MMELKEFFELCEKYNITDTGSLKKLNYGNEKEIDFKYKDYRLNTERDILEKYLNSLSFRNSFRFDYFKNIETIQIRFSSDLSLYDCTVMQDYQIFEKKNKNGEYNSLIEDKTDYNKVYTEFKRLENLTNTLNCLKQVFC